MRVGTRALARLATQGLALSPGEAHDVIHGFLLDQYPRLAQTYDSDIGPFEPYLQTAILHYARRETLLQRRYQGQGIEPDLLLADSVLAPDRLADQALVRDAVESAPSEARRALYSFFEAGSERAAAAHLGWSRHKLRTRLAEGVAHVALAVGRPPDVNPDDWAVTKLVLSTGRTTAEAARVLGLDRRAAHDAHHSALSSLLHRLRA